MRTAVLRNYSTQGPDIDSISNRDGGRGMIERC
jgi:hypothetical protein